MMKFTKFSIRGWLIAIFAIVCLLVNVTAFYIYHERQSLLNAEAWVYHTQDVINTNHQIFTKIQDMQAFQRGYLLTGLPDFLENYYGHGKEIDRLFSHTIELTRDNLKRQKEYARYKAVFERQYALMDKQIDYKKHSGDVSNEDMVLNKTYFDEMRTINADIIKDEQKLLNERSVRERKNIEGFIATILIVSGISIIALILTNGIVSFLAYRRKVAEEDLARINKEMEGFTYIASHDLRSPLVNLKGFASEMKLGVQELEPIVEKVLPHMEPDEQKVVKTILEEDIPDALRYIHSSVEKMDKLTNAILELSRIGRRQLKIEETNTERIVRHIFDTLHHQIISKGVDLKIGQIPSVQADQFLLEQIFGNIIDNAIKYLDPERKGEISVGGSRDFRTTTFWVRDNGRGIGDYDRHKIFEIYRRGGSNEDVPGEGMGMAYVRTTLRRLGGRIWFEPNADHGTTFYFTISNLLKKGET